MKVGVLAGGNSPEYDISLMSAREVVSHAPSGYLIKPIILTKEGKWKIPVNFTREFEEVLNLREVSTGEAIPLLKELSVIFIAMHGPQGEDGKIQGFFEILGIPYTGPDVLGASITMSKSKTHEILKLHGIKTPEFMVIKKWDYNRDKNIFLKLIEEKMGFPCVIKPDNQGSSIGTSIPESANELKEALSDCFKYSDICVCEKYIGGEEFTCSVLQAKKSDKPVALAVTKIVPKRGKFFEFSVKYEEGATEELTPAPISKDLEDKIKEISIKAHEILRAGQMSRTDIKIFRGEIYVLETNSIPGLTRYSIYPKAAEYYGISFEKLIKILVEGALENFQNF